MSHLASVGFPMEDVFLYSKDALEATDPREDPIPYTEQAKSSNVGS